MLYEVITMRKHESQSRGVRRVIRTGGAGHLSLTQLPRGASVGDEKRRRPNRAVVFLRREGKEGGSATELPASGIHGS